MKNDVILGLEEALADLSKFGFLSKYLFITAMARHATELKNRTLVLKLSRLSKQTHGHLTTNMLKKYGMPSKVGNINISPTEMLDYMADLRKGFRDKVKEDATIPPSEKALFTKALTYLKNGKYQSQSAKIALGKIAYTIDSELGKLYDSLVYGESDEHGVTVKKGDIEAMYARLRKATFQITGNAGTVVPADTMREAKGDPKLSRSITNYNASKREIREALTVAIRNLTVDEPMDSDKLAKKLSDLGFVGDLFPTSKSGFDGLVGVFDNKIALFSQRGSRLSSGIAAHAEITMNPRYDPETDNAYILSYTVPGAVTKTRVYTQARRAANINKKFESVSVGMKEVEKWVRTWKRDLKSKDDMVRVPATAAYILYLTGARVGSSTKLQSAKGGEQSFGITTLRKEHITISKTRILIKYHGKKGMKQQHIIPIKDVQSKQIKAVLEKLLTGKKKDDLLFTFPRPKARKNSPMQNLNGTFFRSYLKSTGMTMKIHNLRHIRGTALVEQLLKKTPFKPTKSATTLSKRQREAETFMKDKILSQAAKLLGHKTITKGVEKPAWSTTISNYLKVEVVSDWFKKNSLSIPNWVEKVQRAAVA